MAQQLPQRLVLRCLAYPSKNDGQQGYYAVCIDLSLATWRPTYKEAVQSLGDAIGGYIETVAGLSKEGENWRNLIPRHTPFWPHRFQYRLAILRRAIPRLLIDPSRVLFDEPVDLPFLPVAA